MSKRDDDMPRVTITSDGTKHGTRITAGDEDITDCVRSVRWAHADGLYEGPPTAHVEIQVHEVNVKDSGTSYLGLSDIPEQLLRAELQRRGSR